MSSHDVLLCIATVGKVISASITDLLRTLDFVTVPPRARLN
jgi:hypothetical protein